MAGGLLNVLELAKGLYDLWQGEGPLLTGNSPGSMLQGWSHTAQPAFAEGAKDETTRGHAVEEHVSLLFRGWHYTVSRTMYFGTCCQ